MKKVFFASVMALAAASALATTPFQGGHGSDGGAFGGGGGGGGAGVGVGIGIGQAAATAGAASASDSRSMASNTVGISNSNTLTLGASGGLGGNGGAGGLGGTGIGGTASSTSTGGTSAASVGNVAGGSVGSGAGSSSIDYRAAASTAYAPTPSGPRTSCRMFMGVGGTNTSGSISGGIPIGNDQTCLSGAAMEFMDKVNAVARGTFVVSDYLQAACKVEGMDATQACKKAAEAKRAEGDGLGVVAGQGSIGANVSNRAQYAN